MLIRTENEVKREKKRAAKESEREKESERTKERANERVAQRTTADYNRSIVVSVPHDLRLVYRTRADDDDALFPRGWDTCGRSRARLSYPHGEWARRAWPRDDTRRVSVFSTIVNV